MSEVHLGLKLGQPHEAHGLVVVEREDRQFTVRTIHRFAAGTAYTTVAEQVAEALGKLQEHQPQLYLDITGLGQPIQEIITRRLAGIRCPLFAATFTYGDRCEWDHASVTVGKLYLLSQIKALLQEGWLHLPDTEETRQLVQDIKSYQPTIDPQANDRYGAFTVGRRDELVTALGLAVLDTRRSAQMYLDALCRRRELAVQRNAAPTQGQMGQAAYALPVHKKPWWE